MMTGDVLLHEGGEADIYGLRGLKENLVLKKYKNGSCFDRIVLEKISICKYEGLYHVREFGTRDGSPFIVYEHVDGVTSSRFEGMPVVVALRALRQVARTLAALDSFGVHHGDLSPANVILVPEADAFKMVLIDFGIVGLGALSYAAPERFRGKNPDARSDLFALGMLLYRWISGADFIAADCSFDELAAQMAAVEPQKLTERLYGTGTISVQELSALDPLWNGLVQKNPEDRFEDFDELDEVLEIALNKVGGGEIAVLKAERDFVCGALAEQVEKMRQNVPAVDAAPKKTSNLRAEGEVAQKKFPVKTSVFIGIGLILLIVAVVLVLGARNSGVDEVGALVLQKSRSLEPASGMDVPADVEETLADSSLLKDLPTPERNP